MAELDDLVAAVRDYRGVHDKADIGVVSEVFGASDWVSGPGDDGAAAPVTEPMVVACGEALLPRFVTHDPYGAGLAAVLTNVNDLAAMGANPIGIVNTIVAERDTATEILRGIRYGCELYDVALLGGHYTPLPPDGTPALSAFGVGQATKLLSVTHAQPGQTLIVAAAVHGKLRSDFPFFAGFAERGQQAAGDVRLLAQLAAQGVAVSAKDISMAGVVGSLVMLLEPGRLGATLDLARLPKPEGVALADWLRCFPSFGFLLTAAPDQVAACCRAFHERGLAAEAVGVLDESGRVQLVSGGESRVVWDLAQQTVTGLARPAP